MEHTKTPWKLFDEGEIDSVIANARNNFPSMLSGVVCEIDTEGKLGKANAAFIVKAVNNHESIVKACADALYWLENQSSTGEHREAKQALKEVLAQVSA